MHKLLIATVSTLALTAGAALAQSDAGKPPGQAQIHEQSQSAQGRTGAPSGAPSGASVENLMDRTVIGADGEKIGKVTDVILSPDGQAQVLVVQSGGFLGIGGKDIAIDLGLAEIRPGEDAIKVNDVTQASVRDMPEFQYTDTMQSLNRGPRNDQSRPDQAPAQPKQ